MGIETAIEYCDSTVNAVMGCTGCELLKDHCYARRLCRRYAGRKGWPKDFTRPEYFPGRLEAALRWKDLTGTKRPNKPWLDGMPRVIFVNDLSDGFCPGGVEPQEWLSVELAEKMAHSPHVWLFLTKWPEKMRDCWPWVPDNFWVGTTLLRQDGADFKWHAISEIEGGKKWISFEPLLGSVRFPLVSSSLQLLSRFYDSAGEFDKAGSQKDIEWVLPDFVTAGGETGPGARPMHPDWARGLRNQCVEADMPFFFKSWGEWIGVDHWDGTCQEKSATADSGNVYHWPDGSDSLRIGSKRTGNLLDGRAWQQMPEVT